MLLQLRKGIRTHHHYWNIQIRRHSWNFSGNKHLKPLTQENNEHEHEHEHGHEHGHGHDIEHKLVKDQVQSVEMQRSKSFTNKMSSFIQSSLNSLENFIVEQEISNIPNATNSTANIPINQNTVNIYINQKDTIPFNLRNCNRSYVEYFNLNDVNDINHLLSLDNHQVINKFNNFDVSVNKNGIVNIPLILNFYIRSLPDYQNYLKKHKVSKTELNNNRLKQILHILLSFKQFDSAAFIIFNLNERFEILIDLINECIEKEFIFKNNEWFTYLFLIKLNKYFKLKNSLIMSNIDFLSTTKSMNIFKLSDELYNKDYFNLDDLNNDINECTNLIDDNEHFQNLKLYKNIDLIKNSNLLDLNKQLDLFKKLLSLDKPIFNSSNNGSIFKYLLSLNKNELLHIKEKQISVIETEKFIEKRRNYLLDYAFLNLKLDINGLSNIDILEMSPSRKVTLKILESYMKNKMKNLTNFSKYHDKVFIELLLKNMQKFKIDKLEQIYKNDFSNISTNRKIKMISKSLTNYFNKYDKNSKDSVGHQLNYFQNSDTDFTYVMRKVLYNLFYNDENFINWKKLSFIDLLKFLDVITTFSTSVINKRKLYICANDILQHNLNTGKNSDNNKFFIDFPKIQIFNKLIEFIDIIKEMDSGEPEQYYYNLTPSIIQIYREILIENKNENENGNENRNEINNVENDKSKLEGSLIKLLNQSFDLICNGSSYLEYLNFKNYSSKIYLTNPKLLEKIGIEIFKLPKQLIFQIFDNRLNWLCSNDNDWINSFHDKIFRFNIFLEVIIRRSYREGNKISLNSLNTNEYRKYLDDELNQIIKNEDNWELIEHLSRFKWNEEVNDIIIKKQSLNDNNEQIFGYGVLMVLNKINLTNSLNNLKNGRGQIIKNQEVNYDNDNGNNNNNSNNNSNILSNKSFENITDSLLDHCINLPNEFYEENSTEIQMNQDLSEFNEIYSDLKENRNYRKHNRIDKERGIAEIGGIVVGRKMEGENIGTQKKIKKVSKSNNDQNMIKNFYEIDEKKKLIEFFGPLRMKSLMIEKLVKEEPLIVDLLICRLFNEYEMNIPIILLHSLMIGLIKSDKGIYLTDKLNIIKIIDRITTIMYSYPSNKRYISTYLFMNFVKFKQYRIELIDLIIKESKISNSGSLKTLNWAMKKVMNNSDLSEYKNELNRWTNELNNLREENIGFWNPEANQRWIKR